MATKIRSSISIDPDVWERTKRCAEVLPGGSASALVESSLELALPGWEAVAARLRSGGSAKDQERAALEAFSAALIGSILKDSEVDDE